MPRASTTSYAFNAVAEPRPRAILNCLALQERTVSEIVDALELEQPSVSKHLKVLRDVGLMQVRREGRNMLYQVNGEAIRPLWEWTSTFERFWQHTLLRVKGRAEAKCDRSVFFVPGDAAKSWGANLPGSPVMAADDPEERATIFLVWVGKWSDGSPAPLIAH